MLGSGKLLGQARGLMQRESQACFTLDNREPAKFLELKNDEIKDVPSEANSERRDLGRGSERRQIIKKYEEIRN